MCEVESILGSLIEGAVEQCETEGVLLLPPRRRIKAPIVPPLALARCFTMSLAAPFPQKDFVFSGSPLVCPPPSKREAGTSGRRPRVFILI